MKKVGRMLGIAAFWLGWPWHTIYLRLSERTRILLVCGDNVLVVSSWISDGRWGLPGGGLHRHENPKTGVLRELREELRITLDKAQLQSLGRHSYRANGLTFTYHQFMAEVADELPYKCLWYEIADAKWIDYRELTKQNAGPDVLAAIKQWQAT